MSALLILFFASLIGITVMIGKKLFLLRKEPQMFEEKVFIRTPHLREIRHIVIKKSREYGYIALVETIRFSIRSSKLLKRKYEELKNKLSSKMARKRSALEEENKEKEVSGFLKMISEYKQKIRKIRDQVAEEEKENL